MESVSRRVLEEKDFERDRQAVRNALPDGSDFEEKEEVKAIVMESPKTLPSIFGETSDEDV